MKRILRYVRGTIDFGLKIGKFKSMMASALLDADWAGYVDDEDLLEALLFFLEVIWFLGRLGSKP